MTRYAPTEAELSSELDSVYGACGKGIALRAKGLGARVVVTETHPFAALQAVYDGFVVMPIHVEDAAKEGDIFVTATGSKHVISGAHMATMKDGAYLCNAGQFDYELDHTGLRAMQVGESRYTRPNVEEITVRGGKVLNLLGGGNWSTSRVRGGPPGRGDVHLLHGAGASRSRLTSDLGEFY